MARLSVMSLEDWSKVEVEEIRKRWTERRREIEEVEKRKREIEDKIEIRKKKKEERRKRAIRERRCFVCGIFGHMARYCRNRGEEKRGLAMPQNKFEVLKNRVMQRGEGGGSVGKNRREILKEEREKKTTVQKKDQEKKREKKVDDETEEEKREEGQR